MNTAGKFQKGFDEVFAEHDCQVKKITPCSPNLNAFVERVIQTYQHECLDQFIVISEQQLNVISREFETWYNYEKPHFSVNSLPPGDQRIAELPQNNCTRDVVCSTRQGGLLKHHWRRAA